MHGLPAVQVTPNGISRLHASGQNVNGSRQFQESAQTRQRQPVDEVAEVGERASKRAGIALTRNLHHQVDAIRSASGAKGVAERWLRAQSPHREVLFAKEFEMIVSLLRP
jgi:hypothetical protein